MKPGEEELATAKRRVRELEEDVEILKKRCSPLGADCTSQKIADKIWSRSRPPLQIYCCEAMPSIESIKKRLQQMWVKSGCPSPSDKDAVTVAVIRKIERDNDNNYGIRLSDITYVRVNGAWNYLAAVLDLGRRKVVGWALGINPTAELACRALRNALKKECPSEGLIHHSDRGCQYTSKAYRRLPEQNKITGSMSRKGSPYDNAPMESFFQTLKTEHIYKQSFQTIEQTTASLRYWIDIYYNYRRLNSALGCKSPLFGSTISRLSDNSAFKQIFTRYPLFCELSRYHPFKLSA